MYISGYEQVLVPDSCSVAILALYPDNNDYI